MSWFGDLGSFELFHGKDLLKNIWSHPTRLLTGIEPVSTKLSNTILGRDDKPLVDQMGGATGDDYRKAEAAGINTSAGKGMQNLAHVVAAIEAGGYGANALGGTAGAGAAAGDTGAGLSLGGAEAGTSTGFGLGGDALSAGGVGGGASDFSLGSLGGGSANGAYDMGSMFSSSGGGGTAAGTNWGKLIQSGVKGFNGNAQGSNQAALAAQQALADQLRRTYEQQLAAGQQMPGWVNTSGA